MLLLQKLERQHFKVDRDFWYTLHTVSYTTQSLYQQ